MTQKIDYQSQINREINKRAKSFTEKTGIFFTKDTPLSGKTDETATDG